jgi:hypothetical protein
MTIEPANADQRISVDYDDRVCPHADDCVSCPGREELHPGVLSDIGTMEHDIGRGKTGRQAVDYVLADITVRQRKDSFLSDEAFKVFQATVKAIKEALGGCKLVKMNKEKGIGFETRLDIPPIDGAGSVRKEERGRFSNCVLKWLQSDGSKYLHGSITDFLYVNFSGPGDSEGHSSWSLGGLEGELSGGELSFPGTKWQPSPVSVKTDWAYLSAKDSFTELEDGSGRICVQFNVDGFTFPGLNIEADDEGLERIMNIDGGKLDGLDPDKLTPVSDGDAFLEYSSLSSHG